MKIKISALLLTLALVPALLQASEGTAKASPLERVEATYVCMVNDALFQKAQIPVEVQGKTYFGCCEMCKQRLAEDEGSRTGVDPVSGEKVDKATAIIGAQEDGQVFYFENEENFEVYNRAAKS